MAGPSSSRGRETIRRTDEPEGAGLILWMCAVLFVVVFYVTGVADFALHTGGFSYLGTEGELVGFVFVAACLYTAIMLGSWAATRSFDLPRSLRAAAERTGGMVAEVALLVCVLAAAAAVVVTRSLLYAPMVAALALPAVSTFFRASARRPVAGLPAVNPPRGAHAAMEDDLPEFDPDNPLPEGYQAMHLDWRFDETLSERPRFEHDLVYSLRTVGEMGALGVQPGRTGVALFRHLAVAGVTREVVDVATTLRSISTERRYGVLDEIAHCVDFLTGLITVVPAAQGDQAEGAGRIVAGQYPLVTLVGGEGTPGWEGTPRRRGTLDSVYALIASVLISLGHRVILVEFEDHYSLGVGGASGMPGHHVEHEGERFYFVGRGAGDAWRVDELPPEMADAVLGTVDVVVEAGATAGG